MFALKSEKALLALALYLSAASALNPSCAPGGNFDLGGFFLQLPSGSEGKPDQIPGSRLSGCGGFQDDGHHYFFTESGDGAMVMKAPGGGKCATFPGAPRCRTEFGEANSWMSSGSTNRLSADLAVSSGSSVCIGQVFQANKNNKPLVSRSSRSLRANRFTNSPRLRSTTTAMDKLPLVLSLSPLVVMVKT